MKPAWVAVLVATAFASSAMAGEQTILASKLSIRNPDAADATKRQVAGQGKEAASSNTIVGDPTTSGASVTFFVHGDEQTFSLPQGADPVSGAPLWRAKGSGFVYSDRTGVNGAISSVKLSKSASGVFQIKVKGKATNDPITILPPSPAGGLGACWMIEIDGGDRYHMRFPPPPASRLKKDTAESFLIAKASDEGLCAVESSTTSLTTSTTTSTTFP